MPRCRLLFEEMEKENNEFETIIGNFKNGLDLINNAPKLYDMKNLESVVINCKTKGGKITINKKTGQLTNSKRFSGQGKIKKKAALKALTILYEAKDKTPIDDSFKYIKGILGKLEKDDEIKNKIDDINSLIHASESSPEPMPEALPEPKTPPHQNPKNSSLNRPLPHIPGSSPPKRPPPLPSSRPTPQNPESSSPPKLPPEPYPDPNKTPPPTTDSPPPLPPRDPLPGQEELTTTPNTSESSPEPIPPPEPKTQTLQQPQNKIISEGLLKEIRTGKMLNKIDKNSYNKDNQIESKETDIARALKNRRNAVNGDDEDDLDDSDFDEDEDIEQTTNSPSIIESDTPEDPAKPEKPVDKTPILSKTTPPQPPIAERLAKPPKAPPSPSSNDDLLKQIKSGKKLKPTPKPEPKSEDSEKGENDITKIFEKGFGNMNIQEEDNEEEDNSDWD